MKLTSLINYACAIKAAREGTETRMTVMDGVNAVVTNLNVGAEKALYKETPPHLPPLFDVVTYPLPTDLRVQEMNLTNGLDESGRNAEVYELYCAGKYDEAIKVAEECVAWWLENR